MLVRFFMILGRKHGPSSGSSGIDLRKMKRWSLNVLLVCCVLGWLISVYIGRIKAENGFVVEVLYVFLMMERGKRVNLAH